MPTRRAGAVALVALGGCLVAAVLVGVSGASPSRPRAAAAVVASPAPGSQMATTATQLSFLGAGASARTLRGISVIGSRTGRHPGRVENYASAPGASFIPRTPFAAGERVIVRVPIAVVGAPRGRYSFTVASAVPFDGFVHHNYRTTGAGILHFASDPTLAPSQVSVTASAATAGQGDFFLAPKGSAGQPGPMIVDPSGRLLWFEKLADPNEYAMNFSLQRYGGAPVLTWWQGNIVKAHGAGEDVIANAAYRQIAVIRSDNGLAPDLHDFQLVGKAAWVTSYQAVHWNMTPVKGLANGLVWDGVVQEIDVPTGLVMFEWHSLDHVPVTDSYFTSSPSPASVLDYFHVNSIDVVSPSDVLVSARNTSTVYDVSVRAGGAIRWQLGGKHSTFALGPGVRFNLQHDVRQLPDGTITIFDNNATPVYGPSKALVVRLDAAAHTATLVRSISHVPPLIGAALGNVQTLSGGDLFVSWGTTPYFSEYSPDGALLFEGNVLHGDDTYRAFRFPWKGRPATKPTVALSRLTPSAYRVAVSWNGATTVTSWQVLEGPTPSAARVVASAPWQNFETSIRIPAPSAAGVVIVRALAGRTTLQSSAPVPIP